jgi:hypothetical protein
MQDIERDFYTILQDAEFYNLISTIITEHQVKSWESSPQFAAGLTVGIHAVTKFISEWFNEKNNIT